jgi:bifunctional non-homologous end joining protein LigD
VKLLSRKGNPFNQAFPEIEEAVTAQVRRDVVMDSELAVDDARGHQVFEMVQRRSRMSVPYRVRTAANENPARLYIFDLLALDGYDVCSLPLLDRKRLPRTAFDDSGLLVFVNGIVGLGCAVFEQIVALDLEGSGRRKTPSDRRPRGHKRWHRS